MSEDFKLLDRKLIHHGVVIDYFQDTISLPNGKEALWDIVDHKGAAAVLPVLDNGNILMVRQYRHALGRYTLEIPAGGLNFREEPMEEAAARELSEETGYTAGKLEFLLMCNTTVAFCDEKIGIYLATDLTPGQQHLDEDEFVTFEEHSLDEMCQMIYEGKMTDGKTVAALLTYKAKFNL